jgi:hypothetical protein
MQVEGLDILLSKIMVEWEEELDKACAVLVIFLLKFPYLLESSKTRV